jgi:hypothetical protein
MSWDRGYYYQARKVNGRVVREYVGTGRVAELVAKLDELERERRANEKLDRLLKQAELARLDAPLDKLNEMADLVVRAVLVAAGFRQHRRGEWRKRRVRHEETP